MPSILSAAIDLYPKDLSFKPCYKWNAFNTEPVKKEFKPVPYVLNLVINGMPSILNLIWDVL